MIKDILVGMRFSVNRTKDSALLEPNSEERGAAGKWFVAAIVAILLVTAVAVLALVVPEDKPLMSCRYYESKSIVILRDVATLTHKEKVDLVTTYQKMKSITSAYDPTKNAWDFFVDIHLSATRENVTTDWRFLFWAREFGIRFRREMLRASGEKTLPFGYWNWTNPASTKVLFGEDFLGGEANATTGCVVRSGNFTVDQWPLSLQSVLGESQGLLRCEGNGIQICKSKATQRLYLLDSPFNVPTVDRQSVVGPFQLVGSEDNVSVFLTPDPENVNKEWGDPAAERYYHGSSQEMDDSLQCRHYGGSPLAHNQSATLACKSLAPFASFDGSANNFAACVIGVDSANPVFPLHSLYGALRAQLGGSLCSSTSPNDPVFPHMLANLDRIWTEYQHENPETAKFVNSLGPLFLDEDVPQFIGSSFRSLLDTRERHYTYDSLCTEAG